MTKEEDPDETFEVDKDTVDILDRVTTILNDAISILIELFESNQFNQSSKPRTLQ